uniref:Nucleolar GTP-binding protein 2 n=1 Tax=Solanum tuberosum TaxID=4113 RepID=M1AXE7_SOLTU
MAKNKSCHRSSATTRRLKMYNCRPKRDRKGKILKHKYQSKQLPSTRIQPDPRWFINTRVISQEKLESFREEIQDRLSSNYNIIMNGSNLPMSLVNERKKIAPPTIHEETDHLNRPFFQDDSRETPKIRLDNSDFSKLVDTSVDSRILGK